METRSVSHIYKSDQTVIGTLCHASLSHTENGFDKNLLKQNCYLTMAASLEWSRLKEREGSSVKGAEGQPDF